MTDDASKTAEPILEARHVSHVFRGEGRRGILALDDVSLTLGRGTSLGVVGESGSGKSTLGEIIGGLLRPTAGDVLFHGRDIMQMDRGARRSFRRAVQFVFQDPVASMNPAFTVRHVLADPQRVQGVHGDAREVDAHSIMALERVGLPRSIMDKRPNELSGGQCQRIALARALLPHPEVLVCDECTSALDVSVQAQILNLLCDLVSQTGTTLLFISHDIGVVGYVADKLVVMNGGRLVEQGLATEVIDDPKDPYTRELVDSARKMRP